MTREELIESVRDIERRATPKQLERLNRLFHIGYFDHDKQEYDGVYCGAQTGNRSAPDLHMMGKSTCENCLNAYIARNGIPCVWDYIAEGLSESD